MGIEDTVIPLMRQVIYTTYANFPTAGLTIGDLAWASDRKCLYRWSGSAWESIGISSRHGNYADRGTASDYPESSLYQADDTGALYMVITGAWVFVATSSALFGGQSDVTASRALTTVYQNTLGKPLLASVSLFRTGSNVVPASAYCDANASPSLLVAYNVGYYYTDGRCHISFIVPNGYYYKVTTIGTGISILVWMEYS